MLFLPLPLKKTFETFPELYIIVNGKPTTSKVVWRSLVNVNNVKTAVRKLKEINWLCSGVDDDCRRCIETSDRGRQ